MSASVTKYQNLIEALAAAPRDHPFVTHWIDEDERESVTFGEFRRRAWGQAKVLREHGLLAGDRVIVIMPQSIGAMTVFVGAMLLGGVPAFLAYPNFKVEPEKYRSGLAGVSANLRAKVVVIDGDFPDDLLGHIALGADTELVRACRTHAEAVETIEVDRPGESLAFIQYSAGTTGLQKGVALTHAAVLRQIEHLQEILNIDGGSDCIYNWLPLYHDMGLIACFMLPMVCHLPVVMQSPLDWVMRPGTMLEIISECHCTLAWMPNFAFQFVPRRTPKNRWTDYDLSSVRALINCSEPVRSSSMQEFEQAFSAIGLSKGTLQSCYAMAENVFAVTQSALGTQDGPTQVWADGTRFRSAREIVQVRSGTAGAVSLTSSGRLLPGADIRIVDDSGSPLAPGRIGEILIQSDCLFTGYYNRPDLTTAALVDGSYRSGDLGFLLNDELYVVGRKKDLLIVGGENLYPQDIEEIVTAHPAIHDGRAVAMGLYNPDLGTEDIVVVAELEHETSLDSCATIEQELRNLIVSGTGVAARRIFLKPPTWIVKSTAGKAARSATKEKLLHEHPELKGEQDA
jgi:acyl-CoA synthetase (AMP-forming)/AMP-acid ligase II